MTSESSRDLLPQVPPEGGADFFQISTARFMRRLHERWACDIPGHNYCYILDGAHIILDDDAIMTWVSVMHDGYASILAPPPGLLPITPSSSQSETASVKSISTIEYQRRFRWKVNQNLTDIRSARNRLHSSLSSSSASALSSSTASSGIPGIGYISGKAVKWVGLKLLDGFGAVEIRRRQWVIQRTLTQMKSIPMQERATWLVRHERQIDHIIEDLFELFSDGYNDRIKNKAVIHGNILANIPYVLLPEIPHFFELLKVKLCILDIFLYNNREPGILARNLREILLQDFKLDLTDDLLIVDAVRQIIFELTGGASGLMHRRGFQVLRHLYLLPRYRPCLQNLGKCGDSLHVLARKVFEPQGHGDEHVQAVFFFAMYAEDLPEYRPYLLRPAGIPLLVQYIQQTSNTVDDSVTTVDSIDALATTSVFSWFDDVLAQLNIPALVIKLIMNQRLLPNTGNPTNRVVIMYDILKLLRNRAVLGGSAVKQEILDSRTEDLRQILPTIETPFRVHLGNEYALHVRDFVSDTWL